MSSNTACGSNSRVITPLAPCSSDQSAQPVPLTWATGMAIRLTSVSVHAYHGGIDAGVIAARRPRTLRWESTAPFGRPVVPEVYICSRPSSQAAVRPPSWSGWVSRQSA